ncbi:MAG: sulfate adenylyltransferase [Elusimicrobiota bacterium]
MYKGSPVPHGGKLVERLLPEARRAQEKARAAKLPGLTLSARRQADIEMLGIGAYSPLSGFLGSEDHRSVVEKGRLASGALWTIPITLDAPAAEADKLKEGQEVALLDENGSPLAILRLKEKFIADRKKEAQAVYGTTEEAHPGVAALYAQEQVFLAGDVDVLELPKHDDFPSHRLTPAQTRQAFAERGWRTVVGFQTRNPVHRAHEYLLKCALESCDGLLLHPLVGATKGDDIPADVRMKCYEVLLKNYFSPARVLLSVNPANMYYAGPREAIFHALIRKNFGCTHFIVGRDHAGVGTYYGTYDAQKKFLEYTFDELGIIPLFFENSFWCKTCGGMASDKTCPHPAEARFSLSGTKVRDMLRAGQRPPAEFSRPEVADVLIESMAGKAAV